MFLANEGGDNTEYHLSDVIQLTVIGFIGDILSMAKITARICTNALSL